MEKERNLLQMELETVRRDFEHASQNASKHQELITELRGKLLTSSELVKEKSAEVRKHELTISELTAEVKRIERERTESNHSITTMEGQLQNLRDTLECTRMAMEKTNGINAALEGELQQVKMSQESKDETLVVLRAEYEEKLEVLLCETKNLESEINARQIVIGNLTNQLTEANVANEALFNKVTQSTDCSARLRSSLEKMQICNCDLERRIFFNDEAIARIALQNCWLEENCGIYCDRTATAERSSLYSLTEKNLLNRNLQESIAEKEVTALRLSDVQLLLEKKRIESVEEARRILEVCEERERTIVILQEEVACSAGELLFLKEELLRQKVCVEQLAANERLLAGKLSDTEELLRVTTASSAERAELSRWASEWIGRSIHFCANLVEQCDALMTDKLYHMVMVLTEVYDKRNKETYSALRLLEDAQRNAEEARLHAELKLSEIESRAANGVELLKKQKEDFLSKIRCVEKQKEEADSEIKSLVQKISELKERHSGDMKEKDSKIEELVHAVSTEKSRVQHLEEKMAKLHKKLEYELLRKAEYKEALEIVKAKREETDRYRATEKDLAMKAVDVANKEINYWVRSFEQLKGMLQDLSRRSGTQIAPADQEKIREMEDAVCRMSTRDTNLPKCSPEGRNGSQKRPRTEL
ncbi:unnamed protein product [Trypanosoma congolense IL3000]|uniref:WGS project CAEQ00000000 data, annotated contig 2363 n=1 Tax=Trypanosoma congolense (strain IL3000) TaxID=1068625 RepID=F9WDH4_TRYCI|nr:unnamed protein product [Trypanosoma congolense IL3000]